VRVNDVVDDSAADTIHFATYERIEQRRKDTGDES
jgi:hypothetical protein